MCTRACNPSRSRFSSPLPPLPMLWQTHHLPSNPAIPGFQDYQDLRKISQPAFAFSPTHDEILLIAKLMSPSSPVTRFCPLREFAGFVASGGRREAGSQRQRCSCGERWTTVPVFGLICYSSQPLVLLPRRAAIPDLSILSHHYAAQPSPRWYFPSRPQGPRIASHKSVPTDLRCHGLSGASSFAPDSLFYCGPQRRRELYLSV